MPRRLPARLAAISIAASVLATPVLAQRTGENAVTSADDAFGTSVGNETIGLYSTDEVRGFSPAAAGNIRIDGLYLGGIVIGNQRIQSGSNVRVGLSAQGYPFPAPTGIVELSLRPAGTEPTLSGVLYAGQSQLGIDLDGQLPVSDTLSLAGGIAFNRSIDFPGGDVGDYFDFGIAPAWRPREGTEVRAYYGIQIAPQDVSTPFTFVTGTELPPHLPNHRHGQKWAEWKNRFHTMGLFGHTTFGDWRLSGGIFRHVIDSKRSFNTLFVNAQADGSADFLVNIHPPRLTASNAGEVRLSRSFEEGPRRHIVHLNVRGGTRRGDFGGEEVVDLGPINVGEVPPDFPEPDVEFGEETIDKARQIGVGLAYHGRWQDRGEFSVGIQKVRYRKTIDAPDEPEIVTRAEPWLWNATLAINLAKGLVAYAGYTKGLEDSGVAPEIAVNRSEAPPALLTSQRDFGLRYAFGPMRLVLGAFDVRKPYFNLDPGLVFTQLGTVRHRGVEISLTGEPIKGLNVVAGAILMKPRVSGEAVDLGLIGPKPVGQPERTASLNFDYRLPWDEKMSVNLGIQHLGKREGNTENTLTIPGRTLVNVGGRYRFQVARLPATLRLQLSNLFNDYAWNVTGSGALRRVPPRRLNATLSVDF
ncbi:MAG: TonB-dependent receptor [Pseudomonadota bacterium]|nr:TonB-dependent receptor [Pseudomonadota bacterium]